MVRIFAASSADGPEAAVELPAETLDWAMLDQSAGLRGGSGNVDLLGTLTGLYAESSAADLARVRRLVAEERWPEAARTVHNLKGSSATLGLVRVAAVCAVLEEAARGERPREAAPLILCLEKEIERAQEALAGALRQRRGQV